ncbi:hippocampus abundant transcript-like protein 1 isoform X1 [Cavia porcellus]|uniref:hippocampus abundant transcript-like protein 1 isoform X1 n=1 Tax=Cavia porcellus TaxID=10141 RepID=UPI002FDF92BA
MAEKRAGAQAAGGSWLQGFGRPSVYHAAIVIFLEFFAWGLLTTPMLAGLLSFLSAPLIGALSDVWGRKPFLLGTVFFTCFPIPLMRINPWWYFAMISVSGVFSVTFSVIFAYVADITQEHERSTAYGWVSATFAASLVSSPAIGAFLSAKYGDSLVVLVATVVALLDICFILVAVPESLPEKIRPVSWGAQISWKQADPFASLKRVWKDSTVLLICITVFLSYLPEAGQYSSFFLYLRQVIGFGSVKIAAFIAMVGVLSIVAQTVFLSILMRSLGNKNTVLLGLGFQMLQLAWYGFGSQAWMMWAAGTVAAMSSITFPAVSALVSRNAESDQQGVAQGIITGIRGLCNGLGPALYGFIFYMFHVELSELGPELNSNSDALQHPPEKKGWGANRRKKSCIVKACRDCRREVEETRDLVLLLQSLLHKLPGNAIPNRSYHEDAPGEVFKPGPAGASGPPGHLAEAPSSSLPSLPFLASETLRPLVSALSTEPQGDSSATRLPPGSAALLHSIHHLLKGHQIVPKRPDDPLAAQPDDQIYINGRTQSHSHQDLQKEPLDSSPPLQAHRTRDSS